MDSQYDISVTPQVVNPYTTPVLWSLIFDIEYEGVELTFVARDALKFGTYTEWFKLAKGEKDARVCREIPYTIDGHEKTMRYVIFVSGDHMIFQSATTCESIFRIPLPQSCPQLLNALTDAYSDDLF